MSPPPVQRRRPALRSRLRAIKLLLCDVDGVLTDGTVWIGEGSEAKTFSILDGMGLGLLRRSGVRVGWISGRPSPATARRAAELKIDFLHQAKGGKVPAIEAILRQTGLAWSAVCYVGDDVVDVGALKRAGVAIAVRNAVAEAKAAADYVTKATGGHGAVREVVEMIMKAQGRWRQAIAEFTA